MVSDTVSILNLTKTMFMLKVTSAINLQIKTQSVKSLAFRLLSVVSVAICFCGQTQTRLDVSLEDFSRNTAI
jgi:hypothetical protein